MMDDKHHFSQVMNQSLQCAGYLESRLFHAALSSLHVCHMATICLYQGYHGRVELMVEPSGGFHQRIKEE